MNGTSDSSSRMLHNAQIQNMCSSMINPTDVFRPCKDHCVDPSRRMNLSQPKLMQDDLTKFDDTLKDMYSILMSHIDNTRKEMKTVLQNSNVNAKTIKTILNPKFGVLLHVPDSKKDGVRRQNMQEKTTNEERKMESEKKRRQKMQDSLIRKVLTKNGQVNPKYANIFTLETPFDLSNKGKQISSGGLKTKYNRSDKHIEMQLRFKPDDAFKRVKENTNTKRLIKKLVNEPHANKPLKVIRSGSKFTVARGGDRSMRHVLSQFNIAEFKDEQDGRKQKYMFTDKTQKRLNLTDVQAKRIGIKGETHHPRAEFYKYFDKNKIAEVVDNVFLSYLLMRVKNVKSGETFKLHGLHDYEKIQIPFVYEYKLEYKLDNVKKTFIFEKDIFATDNDIFTLKSESDSKPINNEVNKLTYQLQISSKQFYDYTTTVALVRKYIRTHIKTLNDKNISSFYLRNEDRFRMQPVENILKFTEMYEDDRR